MTLRTQYDLWLDFTKTATECGPAQYFASETGGASRHGTMSCGDSRYVSIQRRHGPACSFARSGSSKWSGAWYALKIM